MATPEIPRSCPSCGKENPPESAVCHFCGASTVERIPLKILGYGIALLLIIAAAHFYLAATYAPDYASITSLTPDRNFERVRVKGRVTNIQIIRKEYEHHQVRIEITGVDSASTFPDNRISVRLEGEPANDFLSNSGFLSQGDLVDVAASLYAGDGYRHLSVSSVQFIRILEKGSGEGADVGGANGAAPYAPSTPAVQTTVAELLGNPEKFRDQVVSARPLEVVEVPEALPFFRACDEGKPEPQLVILGYKGEPLSVGSKISVRGKFIYYEKKGYWEIQVRDWDRGAVIVLSEGAEE